MGQIAIIQTVVGFTIIFLDMGISNAVVYKDKITDEQLSSVYWVNLFSGVFFSIIIYLLAPLIADFYETEALTNPIRIVSFSFFILSISRLYKFLFIKYLQLKEVAISEMISYSIAFVVLLVLLTLDFKVLSFVYSIIIRSIIQSIYLFGKGLKIFKPKLVYNHASLEEFFRYGIFNLGQNLTVYLNSQLDALLIGKLLTLEVLGVYNIAKVLASKPLQLIAPVVSKVTFPLMSKVQNDLDKLKTIYLKAVQYLFVVVVVVYITMIFEAADLFTIIYGSKWEDAIPVFQLITVLYLINAIGNPIGSIILASGKVNWGFYWNLVMLVLLPLVIYFSSRYGIQTMIISLIVYHSTAFLVSFRLITQNIITIKLKEVLFPIMYFLVLLIPSIISMFVLYELIDNRYIRIVLLSTVSLLLYILSIYKFYNSFYKEISQHLFTKK